MNTTKHLADTIRRNDKDQYVKLRYPTIQEGDDVVFEDEDFSNVDFGQFVLGLFVFKHCNLNNSKNIHSQLVIIERCTARNVNINGVNAVIDATDSDFTGMIYDDDTNLANPKENGVGGCSTFTNCIFDEAARNHFTEQGVIFQ